MVADFSSEAVNILLHEHLDLYLLGDVVSVFPFLLNTHGCSSVLFPRFLGLVNSPQLGNKPLLEGHTLLVPTMFGRHPLTRSRVILLTKQQTNRQTTTIT